jgi:hypothetical protein
MRADREGYGKWNKEEVDVVNRDGEGTERLGNQIIKTRKAIANADCEFGVNADSLRKSFAFKV